MVNNKKSYPKTAKSPLLLIVVLLLGSSVLAQSTWWKTNPGLVLDKSWDYNDATPGSQNLGFGLISSPISLGTDHFYMISSADYLKEGILATKEQKTHKIEFRQGNIIERDIGQSNLSKIYYLDSFDNGYIICTNKNTPPPLNNYCKS